MQRLSDVTLGVSDGSKYTCGDYELCDHECVRVSQSSSSPDPSMTNVEPSVSTRSGPVSAVGVVFGESPTMTSSMLQLLPFSKISSQMTATLTVYTSLVATEVMFSLLPSDNIF